MHFWGRRLGRGDKVVRLPSCRKFVTVEKGNLNYLIKFIA
jgi:hypothetical protein